MDQVQIPLATVVALIVAFAPVIYWLVDLVKDIRVAITDHTWNSAVTKLLAVIIAFGVATLIAHSGVSIGKDGGNPLAPLPWQALLLACLVFAATGGLINDHLRAKNPADNTVKAKLLRK